jgi:hypothetical protein
MDVHFCLLAFPVTNWVATGMVWLLPLARDSECLATPASVWPAGWVVLRSSWGCAVLLWRLHLF